MSRPSWMRWGGLVLIGIVAALFASFNSGERVALNLGFVILYRLPLVGLIFAAFLAGMLTMFLLGLRHDLRVRRALQDAGFGEPIAAAEARPVHAFPEAPLSGHDELAEPLGRERPLPPEPEPLERPPP